MKIIFSLIAILALSACTTVAPVPVNVTLVAPAPRVTPVMVAPAPVYYGAPIYYGPAYHHNPAYSRY